MESTSTVHEGSELLLGNFTLHAESIPAADTSLYKITAEEVAFFKTQIGLDDDEELKRHILGVQAKAYKASHYDGTSSPVI
jgi:hypothetical protein